MQGIVRPCRHSLSPELRQQWRAHLCGLCLSLREHAGQASRVLTGYDILLLSVLVEAQAGRQDKITAGRCPLRGMRTAEVVPAQAPAIRLGTTAALLAGAAGIDDKVGDGDLPAWLRPPACRWAARLRRRGETLSDREGLDASALLDAPSRAAALEESGADLSELLAPTGAAVAAMFGHTALVAGKADNQLALQRAGDAFGRLVHLLDAISDEESDRRRHRFNPLTATCTSAAQAGNLARILHGQVVSSLAEAEMADPALTQALFGPVLQAAVDRAITAQREHGQTHRREGAATTGTRWAMGAAAISSVAGAAMFGGGRRRRRYQEDPYYRPVGYGYRRGPSCLDLLACDCCANLACDGCCGQDDCCVACC